MEHRKSRRYRLSAPASFCWESWDAVLHEGKGTTRDICTTGTFIITDAVPQCGAQIELSVYLPSLEGTASAVTLHGEGKVTRVYRQEKALSGFAAEVTLQAEASISEAVLISGKVQ
jgi:hypothetical protein